MYTFLFIDSFDVAEFLGLTTYELQYALFQKKLGLCPNSDFKNPNIFTTLRYLKLGFLLDQLIWVWNIKGLYQFAKLSFLQKLRTGLKIYFWILMFLKPHLVVVLSYWFITVKLLWPLNVQIQFSSEKSSAFSQSQKFKRVSLNETPEFSF